MFRSSWFKGSANVQHIDLNIPLFGRGGISEIWNQYWFSASEVFVHLPLLPIFKLCLQVPWNDSSLSCENMLFSNILLYMCIRGLVKQFYLLRRNFLILHGSVLKTGMDIRHSPTHRRNYLVIPLPTRWHPK